MKKTAIALALFGALNGGAWAQSAVQVYGNLDIGLIKRSGNSLGIGKRGHNTLGLRGSEELAGGWRALYQIEIHHEPDSGLQENRGQGQPRALFQGQSRVGLQGDFGTLRFGRGLTPLQELSMAFEPFHGIPSPSGFQSELMVAGASSDPLGLPGNAANRFSNAVFYNSPEGMGFQLNVSIGTREANGNAAVIGRGSALAPQYPANARSPVKPYSIASTYKNGPVAMLLAMERNALQHQVQAIAGYIWISPETKLMASLSRHDQSASSYSHYHTQAWVIGANHTLGASKVLMGYAQKHSTGMPRVKQFSLGYEYSLSKRTYLYADLSKRLGAALAPAPATSTKTSSSALGVNHSF